MRGLTVKQKRLLDKWYAICGKDQGLGFSVEDCPDFAPEFLEELVEMNDFETIHAEINRYITDKVAEDMQKGTGL